MGFMGLPSKEEMRQEAIANINEVRTSGSDSKFWEGRALKALYGSGFSYPEAATAYAGLALLQEARKQTKLLEEIRDSLKR